MSSGDFFEITQFHLIRKWRKTTTSTSHQHRTPPPHHHQDERRKSPFRSILFHIEGQVPLADNNGPLSACFFVMCRQAAPRQSRAMHPQTIEHLRPTLWQAPSQTVRRSQAARRRLRRRALMFRLGARAVLVGPRGLAMYGTLVNVITSGEHGLDKADGLTFEEQETDSRTCEGDSTFFCNSDVNTNVVGLVTDCTGDTDATVPDSAAMAVRSRRRIISISK